MLEREWLGEDNQLGVDIWEKKYCHDGESFDEWVTRISGGNEEIGEYIKEKKFLFGGRILSNRGLNKEGRKVTYSNGYVIQPPEDNIESIFLYYINEYLLNSLIAKENRLCMNNESKKNIKAEFECYQNSSFDVISLDTHSITKSEGTTKIYTMATHSNIQNTNNMIIYK